MSTYGELGREVVDRAIDAGFIDPADQLAAAERRDELLAGLRDGAWLDAQNFPPLRYAVPGILPEGSVLLVGPPKIGKSWFVLAAGLAIAAGGRMLGIQVGDPRPVLLAALEDGDRRLQDRCRKLLVGDPIPKRFQYLTRFTAGRLLQTLTAWLDMHGDEQPLVVLDTLGRAMPPAAAGESAYQRDYKIGAALKRAVDDHPGATLLTNHHDRKAASEDFVDSVSGTHGLAGAADTIVVLARRRIDESGVLKVTGRDVAEGEYALRFLDGSTWQLDGGDLAEASDRARQQATVDRLGDQSAGIVRFIANTVGGVRAADVADEMGMSAKLAGDYLRRLAEAGRIRRLTRGLYGELPANPTWGSAESVGSEELTGSNSTLSTGTPGTGEAA
jgi:hypothetical protein